MSNEFREARRELGGLTAAIERKMLAWLAARTPAWIGPDHLTALGLVAFVAGGAAYALSRWDSAWLHAVNVCLALNWLGDSLDGTLARHRNRLRPRYGFYVDHVVDAFGALFLLVGLALSGLVHPVLALGLLIAYELVAVEMALAAHTVGVFRMSRGIFGGTELRILLAVANLAALAAPTLTWRGSAVRLFDVLGAGALAGLLAIAISAAVRNAIHLYRLERLPEPGDVKRVTPDLRGLGRSET